MQQLLQTLRPQDWFLLGVLATLWIQARGRRDQGRRIGALEQKIVSLVTAQGMDSGRRLSDTQNENGPRDA